MYGVCLLMRSSFVPLLTILMLALLVQKSAFAADTRLTRGIISSFDTKQNVLKLKRQQKLYPLGYDVEVRLEKQKDPYVRIPIIQGMDVTLYKSASGKITRIVVHGPYSILKQLEQH